MTDKEPMTAEQVAVMLHCSAKSVEEKARRGEIPGTKIGRSWVFVRSQVMDWVANEAKKRAAERRQRLKHSNKPTPTVPSIRRRISKPPVLPAPVLVQQ